MFSVCLLDHRKKWAVSTKNIMFGGKDADIGIALKDTLTIENHGSPREFSLELLDKERCDSNLRYKIVIKPQKFQLEKVCAFMFVCVF